MRPVILFAAGSPLIVDYEETCARLGWPIVAAVRNVAGPVYVSDAVPVIEATPSLRLDHPVVLPLFTPANRQHAHAHAVALGASRFPALLDPTSILPRRIEIGEGTYVNAGCVIGAASRLGRFTVVNPGARLGRHLELGDFASIGPGVVVAGQLTIGPGALIGAGAVLLPGIEIGANAVVGAGAVVRRNVPPGTTVIGRAA